MEYQELFNYMKDEHGVTLLESEMQEIARICEKQSKTLFDLPEKANYTNHTCGECQHKQRWVCGSKAFYYCGARKSKMTSNGLLKIRIKNIACKLFE
jgi:hypothetical protein